MSSQARSTRRQPQQPQSIRGQYEQHGSTDYYRKFGSEYRNPHEPIIVRLLEDVAARWPLNLTRVLDLAAGSGEVTLAMRHLGAMHVDGVDPFTADAYAARTGSAAERLSFEDIAAGAISDRRYSLVVCSFAMHLCEKSRLPALAQTLGRVSDSLLILTPNKRPVIQPQWGWKFFDEKIIDRVRARYYIAVNA